MLYIKLLKEKYNKPKGTNLFLPDYCLPYEGKEFTLIKHINIPKGTKGWAYKTIQEVFDAENKRVDKIRNKLTEALTQQKQIIKLLDGVTK